MLTVILLGAGGHAAAVVDLLESSGRWRLGGVLEDRDIGSPTFMGIHLLGKFRDAEKLIGPDLNFVISVGQIGKPGLRKELYEFLQMHEALTPTLVSPHAYVSGRSTISKGSTVFPGAVVNANASIGENCIINSMALVEHDSKIGDHTHISTGARINGGVQIGSESFVGSGAIVYQGVNLPAGTVVPAGKIVR
jgi:sugar O-acyltransferase (sialic acid O-acetyltransferase NeuD family)